MKQKNFTLIGIDGGATKVSAWTLNYNADKKTFNLTEQHQELPYSAIDGYLSDFTPVSLQDQLAQRETGNIKLTRSERQQGQTYTTATAQVILELVKLKNDQPVLIGIGMPGLKTADGRGINAIANGPRMPGYCEQIEQTVLKKGVELLAPIAHLGSDADYCGIGELYAEQGSFQHVNNAYYLGGGTGAADAMLLKGKLVPFDEIKSWMAKTWEMKNDKDLSFERYASASGLQFIYSQYSGKSVEELNAKQIYPPRIARLAIDGEQAAINTFSDAAKYLSLLIFERISTLFCGSKQKFDFINPNRPALETVHMYRGEYFDRIVIGQRLGDLMQSKEGHKVLTRPIFDHLSATILSATCLPEKAKNYYLENKKLKKNLLVFSKLREAPALGAGIDAQLNYLSMKA